MICCLNPNCLKPENVDNIRFCKSCYTSLLILDGRYKPIRFLGGGGFGRTYLAEDQKAFNAPCVIKQLLYQIRDNAPLTKVHELFEREALTLQKLSHPQIPDLMAYVKAGDRLYLVQSFFKGQNLDAELKKNGSFSESKLRDFLVEILEILDFVHQKGVIHRDLKPANIMRCNDGKLALIDFGLTKSLSSSLKSGNETVGGTKGFASPEQMEPDGEITPASDLYSLGATCFNLLTQVHPSKIRGENWKAHLKMPLNPHLSRVMDKLLKLEANQRYQSAAEVLRDLQQQESRTRRQLLHFGSQVGLGVIVTLSAGGVIKVAGDLISSILKLMSAPSGNNSSPPTNKPSLATATPTATSIAGKNFIEDLGKGVTLEMLAIPGGHFLMGSPDSEKGRFNPESPQHDVTVQPFYMGKFEVTQAQYTAIMGSNPSFFKGENYPVEQVSWDDAQAFCQKLSAQVGRKYRLPSEAEWEYACRAGTTTAYYFGDDESQLGEYAWYANNSGDKLIDALQIWRTDQGNYLKRIQQNNGRTHPVGKKKPSAWGLYDMHGNVWEWCEDTWHDKYHGAPIDGSAWITEDDKSFRLLRGGSWAFNSVGCRSAIRFGRDAGNRNRAVGFRVVCLFP